MPYLTPKMLTETHHIEPLLECWKKFVNWPPRWSSFNSWSSQPTNRSSNQVQSEGGMFSFWSSIQCWGAAQTLVSQIAPVDMQGSFILLCETHNGINYITLCIQVLFEKPLSINTVHIKMIAFCPNNRFHASIFPSE